MIVSYEVNHGPAMRIIIDFENMESGLSVIQKRNMLLALIMTITPKCII